jgi:transcriptional regulator with XRE-family HTH domain
MDMKNERLNRHLTVEEVAVKLKVSARTVVSWENGNRNPSKQIIMLVNMGVLDEA